MPQGHRKARISLADVDNPYFAPDHAESATNPRKTTAAVNRNSDAIVTLRSRGVLGDSEFATALQFQSLLNVMDGLKAFDPGQIRVDGGRRVGAGFGQHQVDAGRRLRESRDLLGERQYQLLQMTCAHGCALGELPGYGNTPRARHFVTDLLRLCAGRPGRHLGGEPDDQDDAHQSADQVSPVMYGRISEYRHLGDTSRNAQRRHGRSCSPPVWPH